VAGLAEVAVDGGDLEPVALRVAEVLDHVPLRGIGGTVDGRLELEEVRAGPAVEDVPAAAAEQAVVPVPAVEEVGARGAPQGVDTGPAVGRVGAGPAAQDVVAVGVEEGVVAGRPVERVPRLPSRKRLRPSSR
jgi:hypothetical protein